MHVLQRKAILALLGMVESAVREIRSVLAENSADIPLNMAQEPGFIQQLQTPRDPHDMSLSDEEDDTLEQMMEKHRLSLLQSSEKFAAKIYADTFDEDA